jgi:hypothetical protein
MTYGKLPAWQQGDDHWTNIELAFWLSQPTWAVEQAVCVLTGEKPDKSCADTLSLMDGREINRHGAKTEQTYCICLKADQNRIEQAARARNMIHATPAEWVSLAESSSIVVGWKQLAIESGLFNPLCVVAATAAPVTQRNKLRRNSLDPAIDDAIKQAGSNELAAVYLKLKAMALDEKLPFTGALDGDALCYTDDENNPAKLSKDALGKRLKRR